MRPVLYLIQRVKKLPHQKHNSHLFLADYGTDQFSNSINYKGNDIVVKSLDSVSVKSIIPFQNKFKTPAEEHKKYRHQYSLLLNETDVTSDDNIINTGIPNSVTFSSSDHLKDTYQTPNL